MQQVEALGLIPPVPSLLGTYLRNRLLHVEGREPDSTDVQLALEDALHKGSPELLVEAESYLSKVGSHGDRVTLTSTVWTAEAPGTAALTWKDCTWDVLDYGDQLPCSDGRRAILEPQQEPQPEDEPRQCLVLHVAAALLYAVTHRLPTHAEVVQRAHLLRDETISAARAAQEVLGDAPAEISRAENDLRIFIHDTLFFGHDKDYRSLAAFPPADLDSVTLHVMRLDSWKRPTVESIAGLVSQDEQVAWLLVYDGHMRLLVPRSNLPRDINALGCRLPDGKCISRPLTTSKRALWSSAASVLGVTKRICGEGLCPLKAILLLFGLSTPTFGVCSNRSRKPPLGRPPLRGGKS